MESVFKINSGCVNIDGDIYEKVYNVALCKHKGNYREFLFECKGDGNFIGIADTMHGNSIVWVGETQRLAHSEILKRGAYFPLKQIIRMANKDEIKALFE